MKISGLSEQNEITNEEIFHITKESFLIGKKTKEGINESLLQKNASEILRKSLIELNIDKVILLLTNYGDEIDFEEFCKTNNDLLLKFFKKFIKGKSGKETANDMGFIYIFDIEKIVFFYNIFGNILKLDVIIKANLLSCLSSTDSFKRAFEIYNNFPNVSFEEEVKTSFLIFIKKHELLNLDVAILIKNKFPDIDFGNEIKGNELNIKAYLKKAGKKYDIERLSVIKNNFGNYILIEDEMQNIFVDYVKNSYWNAKLLCKHIDLVKVSGELKDILLQKVIKGEITQAKKIIADFGTGINFEEEVKIGIDYLQKEYYLEKAKKATIELL